MELENSSLFLKSKDSIEVDKGFKKQELPRNPTRINDLYSVVKPRFEIPPGKENSKENSLAEKPNSLRDFHSLTSLGFQKRQQLPRVYNVDASTEVSENTNLLPRPTIERCSQNKFRSVKELSSGVDASSSLGYLDMGKALKGMVACEPRTQSLADAFEKFGDNSSSCTFYSEFELPGQKVPLDFSLKNCMRVVSSSSVNWFQRSILSSTYNGTPSTSNRLDQNISGTSGSTLSSQVLNSQALHSWVYPSSTLPPAAISVLTSAAASTVETDFLRKRQVAWQDSFRSLYYMLRNSGCSIFYVCTPHFVVMFTAGHGTGTIKRSCNAYISRSTRSLRKLLKEQDTVFSMPLCRSQVEQVTIEDLAELSEIEKSSLGQTCRQNSLSDLDNTPQSMLLFAGNVSVHGLYDVLLNYKCLSLMTTVDVPVLYSPVPFQNAALSAPEFKCLDVKKNEYTPAGPKGDGGSSKAPSHGVSGIVEIKDSYIPPWIISSVCSIMSADGKSFDASFVTEQTSIGLNIGLPANDEEYAAAKENSGAYGIEGVVSPQMRSGHLKSLKYCNSSYYAYLSPF